MTRYNGGGRHHCQGRRRCSADRTTAASSAPAASAANADKKGFLATCCASLPTWRERADVASVAGDPSEIPCAAMSSPAAGTVWMASLAGDREGEPDEG